MDALLRQVAGDLGPGVVGAEGFLVDVFLEDVAQHVGVDLVGVASGGVVQVPGEAGEQIKDALEGRVGHAQGGAQAQGAVGVQLQFVGQEQAAIQVRDAAGEGLGGRAAVGLGLGEGFEEQRGQEFAVEPIGATLLALL